MAFTRVVFAALLLLTLGFGVRLVSAMQDEPAPVDAEDPPEPAPKPRRPVRITPDRVQESAPLTAGAVVRGTARVSGRVVASGRGVPRAAITVVYQSAPGIDGPFATSMDVETDDDGRFELDALEPGRVRVLADHDALGSLESADLELGAGARVDDVELTFATMGRLAGRVVDERGAPVSNARISTAEGGDLGTTGPDGRFMSDVNIGSVALSAEANGYTSIQGRLVHVEAGVEAAVTLVVASLPGFGGVVVRPDGTPAADASVTFEFADGTRGGAAADREGRFWFDESPAGGGVAWAWSDDLGPSVKLPVGGRERNLRLVLSPGGRIVGRVVDARGAPIAEYALSLVHDGRTRQHLTEVSSPDGRFTLPSVAPGAYAALVLVTGKPELLTPRWSVFSGRTLDLGRIVVGDGASITGRVVDAVTGAPLPGVLVRTEGALKGASVQSTVAGPNGRFRLNGIAAGSGALYFSQSRHVTRMLSLNVASDGRETALGDVTLMPGDVRSYGMQYSGVGIAIDIRGDRALLTTVFPGGAAAAAGLQPGAFIVSVEGQPVGSLNGRDLVGMLRGEAGTAVVVEVEGPDGGQPTSVRLVRSELVSSFD